MSCELQRTGTPRACIFLCARRAEKFQKFCNFYGAILAQQLRDLDAKRALFRNGTQRRLGELQRRFFEYAQRSLAGFEQFLCARRAGNPEILQFFRATLAQNLRDIDARRAMFRIILRSSRKTAKKRVLPRIFSAILSIT